MKITKSSRPNMQYGRQFLEPFLKSLNSTSKEWTDGQAFQSCVFKNASNILARRLRGWFINKNHYDGIISEEVFKINLKEFEIKHYASFKRWKKLVGLSRELKTICDESSESIEDRIRKLLLYYLIYGEIHDFRGLKNVFNVFYYVALIKYHSKETMIADWVRRQGSTLYQLMGVVYSNSEMNQDCFNHDDLDDLCASHQFLHKRFLPDCDFLKAFDLHDVQDGHFIHIAKLMKLQTPLFVKYWLKSSQTQLVEEDVLERERWIRREFFAESDENLSKLYKELDAVESDIVDVQKEVAQGQEKLDTGERYKPDEKEFSDVTLRETFTKGLKQLETVLPFLALAESKQNAGNALLSDAKIKYWREDQKARTCFRDALIQLHHAERDLVDARKGFTSAVNFFSKVSDVGISYLNESQLYLSKTRHLILRLRRSIICTTISMTLQLRCTEAINQDRKRFAQKWKTFFEKAGGIGGYSAYITTLHHYSSVVYLHLFLLIPMAWICFDYFSQISANSISRDFRELFKLSSLMDVYNNAILTTGVPVVLMLLFGIIDVFYFRYRSSGYSAPRRDKGTHMLVGLKRRIVNLTLWICVLISELIIFKYMILSPLRDISYNLVHSNWHPVKSIVLLVIYWVPVIALYFSSMQFVYTLWVGVFGWVYGTMDGVTRIRDWDDLVDTFYTMSGDLPVVVRKFRETMIPDSERTELPKDIDVELGSVSALDKRDFVAFAKVWNEIIYYFYETHRLSKEETQRYSFDVRGDRTGDFLSGDIEKQPELDLEPKSKNVKYHLIRFVNNIFMSKPHKRISIREMLPMTVVTPVGSEKVLYPYEYITHVDNTQNSFLQHLMESAPHEWENFKAKECSHPKAADFITRLQKDISQGVQPDQSPKRWIHKNRDGKALKLKLCEWASLRFQALYRTVHGFMQIPRAMTVLARIENPTLCQAEAEDLVREKFSYIVGCQSYGSYYKVYQETKSKAEMDVPLTKQEAEAHHAIYSVQLLLEKFPDLKIAYTECDSGKCVGRLVSGQPSNHTGVNYSIEMFGPFEDFGLGKPTNQNFVSQFIDGMVVQTIDVNQDNVLSQSFFIPNAIAEFHSSDVKIVGFPEYVTTTKWSSTAWCSAFAERTFGTLIQRTYSRMGVRLHYGHPDMLDALWIMSETGLSKMPYVSEDIFTGLDTVIKGGKIIHVEYHEVGKARDVDLYTTTKFIRKISMGASQLACSRYALQSQSSHNVGFFQGISMYYSTVGFYLNHRMLYFSIWFTLLSQFLVVIVQEYILQESVPSFFASRIFSFQIALALSAPGVLQIILENGLIRGLWIYITKFFILAIYSTFHILNISAYWQWGLTRTAFYLPSGRGSGLEHYFMRDLFRTFYVTHWRPAFLIFWIGVLFLILSGDVTVFIFLYLVPAGIWLWGASFLNPGALPILVHEEQWKRLTNRDLQETKQIINEHVKIHQYQRPAKGNILVRTIKRFVRDIKEGFISLKFLYIWINFTIHTRITRLIAMLTIGYEMILAPSIPTLIFSDERRRILRWDEEDARYRSAFVGSVIQEKYSVSNNNNNRSREASLSSVSTPCMSHSSDSSRDSPELNKRPKHKIQSILSAETMPTRKPPKVRTETKRD